MTQTSNNPSWWARIARPRRGRTVQRWRWEPGLVHTALEPVVPCGGSGGSYGVRNPCYVYLSRRTNSLITSLPEGMKTMIPVRSDVTRMPSIARLLTLCGAVGLIAGCASEPSSHVVSAPPPPPPTIPAATVYSTPAPIQATVPVAVQTPTGVAMVQTPVGASSVVVMQAPPSAQQEVPSARPSASHAWVPGYWTWRNNQYQWMAGRWDVPPRTGGAWIPPRWQQEGTSWRFYEGYWD